MARTSPCILRYTNTRPWFYPKNSSNGSTVCECGSPVGYTVRCSTESQQLEVLVCYCMTYNKETASFVVGMCFYACFFANTYYTIPRWVNATYQNAFLCNSLHFHRDGQLCGACEDGFAPPVYSYSLACVECSNYLYCQVQQLVTTSINNLVCRKTIKGTRMEIYPVQCTIL